VPSPIASPEEITKCDSAIRRWARSAGFDPDDSPKPGRPESVKGPAVLAVENDPALARWYIRLKGEEKEVVTIWLTIQQRTLRHETHFMPAPETNLVETYEYLLRRNSSIHGMRFCLGHEDAVFLVGELPVREVSEDEIDRIVGSSLEYVDAFFPAAMQLGYAGSYKRRRRR
jgi:hypothetical protein